MDYMQHFDIPASSVGADTVLGRVLELEDLTNDPSRPMIGRTAGADMIWKAPFGNDEDQVGAGFGGIDPAAFDTNNDYVAETYYRMQFTPFA